MDLPPGSYRDPIPAKRIRRLVAVPRDAELEDALASMRRHGAHVAKSVDPTGTTLGLLFLEDVLEVLVGEINDATAARRSDNSLHSVTGR